MTENARSQHRQSSEIVRKEFYQIRQDKRMLGVSILAPIVQVLLLGMPRPPTSRYRTMVVCDLDRTAESRALRPTSSPPPGTSCTSYCRRPPRRGGRLHRTREGHRSPGHPAGFRQGPAWPGSTAPVQMLLDGADANTANILLGYASQIVGRSPATSCSSTAVAIRRGRPARDRARTADLVQPRPEELELHGAGRRGPGADDHHHDADVARHREGEGDRDAGTAYGHPDPALSSSSSGSSFPFVDHRVRRRRRRARRCALLVRRAARSGACRSFRPRAACSSLPRSAWGCSSPRSHGPSSRRC